MNNFYFNGYYSNEMGLIVEEKSIYNGPQPDFEMISVPGRDGDVILDHNRYKNVEVSYTVSFIGTKEKAAALRQWLCRSADYGYLFDSGQPDHFRYAVLDYCFYGSGTITLNIDYRSYTIKDVSNHVTPDGELMNAYAGSTLLNDKIQFTEWPTLRRGTRTIEWIGNVRSLYITTNRRTL